MERKILHLDLDAFFCAVEEQFNPHLRGKPFAVGGAPETRGVVASCSYPARQFGVRSAMPMARALRLCPDLIIVSHRHRTYSAVSRQVMRSLRAMADVVEQISIDEAFLDMSARPEQPEILARQLQARVRQAFDLPCSIGAATNKLVAKIATDVGKAAARSGAPPNAIQVVPPGQEAAFLAPLPVDALWGVGPKTATRLNAMGIHTIGELARLPQVELARRFGKHGGDLARRARGIDDRPVSPGHTAKSMSRETTFARDVQDGEALRATLQRLSASVARRLQRARLSGTTVKLKIRWPDFTTLTRQASLDSPVDQAQEIYAVAERLFARVWRPGRLVRLLGVGVSDLAPAYRQLSLWDSGLDAAAVAAQERERRLRATVEDLKARFGEHAVWWGDEPQSLE